MPPVQTLDPVSRAAILGGLAALLGAANAYGAFGPDPQALIAGFAEGVVVAPVAALVLWRKPIATSLVTPSATLVGAHLLLAGSPTRWIVGVFAGCLTLAAIGAVAILAPDRYTATHAAGRCRDCGYPIDDLPAGGVCPECGAAPTPHARRR